MPTFASYDGAQLFGRAVTMVTLDDPPAEQINDFIGAAGVESLFLGNRGRVTEVEGLLFGEDGPSLAAAENNFRSYRDGSGRVLVDTYGQSWASVRMGSFIPSGKIMNNGNGYFRRYKAVLNHNR